MSDPAFTNIHEAKTHLSKLIERALQGEEVVIAKAGTPLVKLVAYEATNRKEREGGQWAGQVWVSDDFDAPDPELERLFYEGPIFPSDDKAMNE